MKLDFHSLYLDEKDTVTVIQKAVKENGDFSEKQFTAFFMGMRQFSTYSPWMYVFAIKHKNESIEMKYISPNEIKELNYTIDKPSINMLSE